MVSENGGVDVLAVMDADGRAVALAADEMKTQIARDSWQAHLGKHDEARAVVAELIEAATAVSDYSYPTDTVMDRLREALARLTPATQ